MRQRCSVALHSSVYALLLLRVGAFWDANRSVLFIHIPKTGGSAITQALIAAIHRKHGVAPAARVQKDLLKGHLLHECDGLPRDPLKAWPDILATSRQVHMSDTRARAILQRCYGGIQPTTSFAIVRNPLELRVSAWLWLRRHGSRAVRHLDFETYISSGAFADPRLSGLMAFSQSSYVGPHTTLMPYECEARGSPMLTFIQQLYPTVRALPRVNVIAPSVDEIVHNMSRSAMLALRREFASDFLLWRSAVKGAGSSATRGSSDDSNPAEDAPRLCSYRFWTSLWKRPNRTARVRVRT